MIGQASIRALVVAVATFILYLRMPGNFTNPQFWAEDGAVFFTQAMDKGWESLTLTAAGYFTLLQRLVALWASYFPAIYAPAIYNYFAFAFTLFTVALATSPRLTLPLKPLLGLAIVLTPMGFEVLGTLANTQWLAPVAALLVMLLRPSQSRFVLFGEVLFLAIASLTGPFALFLFPLCIVLAVTSPDDMARRRLLLLSAALAPGFLISVVQIVVNRGEATSPPGIPLIPSTWDVWIDLPMTKLARMFGGLPDHRFVGHGAAIIGAALGAALLFFSWQEPYRRQKMALLFVGAAVMFSGMAKYRASLPFLFYDANTRYFYAASILLIAVFICLATSILRQRTVLGVIVAAEVFSFCMTIDTPRNRIDYEWQQWASQIPSDKTLRIPIAPQGWFIVLDR